MKQKTHNRLKSMATAALAALLIGAFAPAVHAQTSRQVVLDPGTIIPVKLSTELSSSTSRAGDTFTASVDSRKAAYNSIMQGGIVQGVVRQATPHSGDQPGTLDLSFTRLTLPDGRSFPLSGTPASLDTKNLKTRSDGVLVAKNTNKDQHLTYAGIGAGAGLLAGILGGGKIKIEDILIGGGLGYAAGSVLKGPKEVHDVNLTPGTEMGVLVGRRVQYYHKVTKSTVKHHALTHHHSR